MIDKYRALFLTPLGREVLTDILFELRFGCSIDFQNPLQVTQHNVAVMLLNKLGILAYGTLNDVVDSLASVSPKEPIITHEEDKLHYFKGE